MVSAEIAVVMAVPIENPSDCEVRGVISFLQADDMGILPKRQALAWNCSVARQRTSAYCPADTSLTALREQFHWDVFEHPPYSPDLASPDFLPHAIVCPTLSRGKCRDTCGHDRDN